MRRIVLAHGWGVTAIKLEPLADLLKKEGWQVLNLDLPGFGADPPGTVWGVEDYADWVAKQVKGKYIFFGHSFGGSIAVKMAQMKAKGLMGIVVCAPGGFNQERRIKLWAFEKAAKVGKRILGESGIFRKYLYKLAGVHDYEKSSGIMREVFKKVIKEDLVSQLGQIEIPTLVLWGSRDGMVSVKGGELITNKVAGARLEIFKGETHKLPYNQPEWVAERIIEWAKRLN